MKSIDFADEVIETTNETYKKFMKQFKNISRNYSQESVEKCFDRIVNLFKNYDRNKPCEFNAYLNCIKNDKFDNPVVVFPLRENDMETFIEDIVECDKSNLLIFEWTHYLKKHDIEWFPFHLVDIRKRGDFNDIEFPPNNVNEISIIFYVDKNYKSRG